MNFYIGYIPILMTNWKNWKKALFLLVSEFKYVKIVSNICLQNTFNNIYSDNYNFALSL